MNTIVISIAEGESSMNMFNRYGFIISAFMALIFILTGFSFEVSAKKSAPSVYEKVIVKVDGETIQNASGYINNKRTTMLPLRAISERLGYNVSYKKAAKTIELTRGPHWIVVKQNEDSYHFGKMAPQQLGTIPEVMNGTTFVPASFITEILKLDMQKESEDEINIISEQVEERPFIIGMIASIEKLAEGVKIELDNENTSQGYQKIFLITDAETTIINPLTNKKVAVEHLQVGERIRGFYGPVVAEIYPPQSYTGRIELIDDKMVKREVITEIHKGNNAPYMLVGTMENGVKLFITEETLIVTSEDQTLSVEDLQVGMRVDAFYGPIQTMSLPPMSSAVKIMVLK